MALSLERMKELEEQVKAIPMLQVNFTSLYYGYCIPEYFKVKINFQIKF